MKKSLFFTLAKDGLKKNRQVFFPYMIICVAMVAIDYIMQYLSKSTLLAHVRGGVSVQALLGLGTYILAFFAVFILLYSHSFLLKHRKKEFGLYYILGLNKKNLLRICAWETLITALISIGSGLILGILFSKAAELLLLNIMTAKVNFSYEISGLGIAKTVVFFVAIFLLQFIAASFQMVRMQAVHLLQGDKVGEKPPKGNFLLAFAGVAILAFAYGMAITIKQPLKALSGFFIAVVLVIVATYLLFIAGSVFLCKLLKKNKGYYYKANHFVSVSSMSFRMKRNGAGLASICILSTMVLVTIATTVCLYLGTDDAVKMNCPTPYQVSVYRTTDYKDMQEYVEGTRQVIGEQLKKQGVKINVKNAYMMAMYLASNEKSGLALKPLNSVAEAKSDEYVIQWMSLADYNANYHKNESLADNEILLDADIDDYAKNTVTYKGQKTFQVKKRINMPDKNPMSNVISMPVLFVVSKEPPKDISYQWNYGFDGKISDRQWEKFQEGFSKGMSNLRKGEAISYNIRGQKELKESYLTEFGGILFLGCMLSIVFMMATVLIIYYKQVAEGYEDAGRFDIMKKVGMSEKGIKKSINSQLLLVFYLPLLAAGCHLCFAFPMIRRLLFLAGFINVKLFLCITAGAFGVFALFYMLVYKLTANEYYRIVR